MDTNEHLSNGFRIINTVHIRFTCNTTTKYNVLLVYLIYKKMFFKTSASATQFQNALPALASSKNHKTSFLIPIFLSKLVFVSLNGFFSCIPAAAASPHFYVYKLQVFLLQAHHKSFWEKYSHISDIDTTTYILLYISSMYCITHV